MITTHKIIIFNALPKSKIPMVRIFTHYLKLPLKASKYLTELLPGIGISYFDNLTLTRMTPETHSEYLKEFTYIKISSIYQSPIEISFEMDSDIYQELYDELDEIEGVFFKLEGLQEIRNNKIDSILKNT